MRRAEPAAIGTTWRSYVAEAPAWGIVAGALAVSFWTQVGEVQRHGFAVWEAWIWGARQQTGRRDPHVTPGHRRPESRGRGARGLRRRSRAGSRRLGDGQRGE